MSSNPGDGSRTLKLKATPLRELSVDVLGAIHGGASRGAVGEGVKEGAQQSNSGMAPTTGGNLSTAPNPTIMYSGSIIGNAMSAPGSGLSSYVPPPAEPARTSEQGSSSQSDVDQPGSDHVFEPGVGDGSGTEGNPATPDTASPWETSSSDEGDGSGDVAMSDHEDSGSDDVATSDHSEESDTGDVAASDHSEDSDTGDVAASDHSEESDTGDVAASDSSDDSSSGDVAMSDSSDDSSGGDVAMSDSSDDSSSGDSGGYVDVASSDDGGSGGGSDYAEA
jgi:hypothetical protein